MHPDVERVSGTDLADALIGNAGEDELFGMGGDDRLEGGGGNAPLEGDEGEDSLFGGPGADQLRGGYDDDASESRDGDVDGVACDRLGHAQGLDTVIADPGNVVASDCETVDRGWRRPTWLSSRAPGASVPSPVPRPPAQRG